MDPLALETGFSGTKGSGTVMLRLEGSDSETFVALVLRLVIMTIFVAELLSETPKTETGFKSIDTLSLRDFSSSLTLLESSVGTISGTFAANVALRLAIIAAFASSVIGLRECILSFEEISFYD